MDGHTLAGAHVAIVTPFAADGSVDEEAYRRLVDTLIEGGVDGIVAVGTTGESATLSTEEKLAVFQITVDQVKGRVPVTAGVGSNNTAATLELAQRARDLDVDALLVVTPYYNKPSQEGLYQHFISVAEAVPLPQIVYNVPGRTSRRIEIETLARLAPHPHIAATKDATGDMIFASDTLAACGDAMLLLSGDDGTTFPFLALGGHGAISVVGNVAPALFAGICDAARDGRWDEGRALHHKMMPLFHALFCEPNPVPAKAALAMMGQIQDGLRLPLVPMSEAGRDRLRSVLVNLELLHD